MVDLARKDATQIATGEIPAGVYNATTFAWTFGTVAAGAINHTFYSNGKALLINAGTGAGMFATMNLYSSNSGEGINIGANAGAISFYGNSFGSVLNGSIASAGNWFIGPPVTNNFNGVIHRISGGIAAANVTSVNESGDLIIGTNLYANAASGNSRSDTVTGGMGIRLENRTTNVTALEFLSNLVGDGLTTAAITIGSASHTGAWIFGPAAGGVTHSFRGITFFGTEDSAGIAKVGSTSSHGYIGLTRASVDRYYSTDGGGNLLSSTSLANVSTETGTIVGTQTSDIRLKTEVAPLSYGLAEVCLIEPISFMIYGKRQIGFSAQQVRSILPEVVYDTGEVLEGYEETKLAMHYSHVTAALVNAVKELKAEFDAYKAANPVRK